MLLSKKICFKNGQLRYKKVRLGQNTVKSQAVDQSTEVRFASFLSSGFTTVAVINPSERKLAKQTFVQTTTYSITLWYEILVQIDIV